MPLSLLTFTDLNFKYLALSLKKKKKDFSLSDCIIKHFACEIFCIIWSKAMSPRKRLLKNGEKAVVESKDCKMQVEGLS